MRIKKLLAIILIAVLTLSQAVVLAAAETAGTSVEVGVEAATATPVSSSPVLLVNKGDTVTVRLSITQNDGISYMKFKLSYDTELFTLTDVKTADISGLTVQRIYPKEDKTLLMFDARTGSTDSTYTGFFAEINFTAKNVCSGDELSAFAVENFSSSGSQVASENGSVELIKNSVDVLVHNFEEDFTVTEPTCTEAGYTTFRCADCGREVTNEFVPANGHTPKEAVMENEVDATCKEEGSYDSVVYCSVCDEELSRETFTVDKVAHTPAEAVKENIVDATCTEQGSYDSVIYCSVCEEELSRETVTTELIAHTLAAAVKENEVDATCTETGRFDSVVYCSVCDEELSRETFTVDKVAHTPAEAVKENIVDATCTEQGSYDSVIYCSVCEEELSRETVTTELIAHTLAAAVKENETAATVKAEGSYDSVVYCSVCKTELSREKVTVDKLPETKIEVAENDHMKFLADKGILIIDGSVTKEILMKNCNATSIADAEGKAPEDDTLKTGMQLLMFVGDERTDAVTLALLGDVDCNGTVSVADARLALRKAVGLEDNLSVCSLFAADVDFTGDVTVSDARVILRIAVSLEDGKDLIAKSKTAK